MTNHSERKHSEFSPSSAYRWMNCAGSVRLSRKAPPQVDSAAAREGTDAHECLEYIVKRYANLNKAISKARQRWPSDMVNHCIDAAREVFALRPSPTAKLLVETRIKLDGKGKRVYGTLDYAWVDLEDTWGELVVNDFKYGQGIKVFARDENGEPNPQLMIYAAGVLAKYGDIFGSVKISITQPRIWHEDESQITESADVSVQAVRDFTSRVEAAIKLARSDDAPLKAGYWCKWCPASTICPKISTEAAASADIVFDDATGAIVAAPEPFLLTAQTLPKLLGLADQLEIWIKGVRAKGFELAEAGEEIPGYKLVARRGRRRWVEGAERKARKRFGDEVIYKVERKLISPAQLEKAVRGAKKFTRKYSISVSSGAALVADSDRRAEIASPILFDVEE